MFIADIFFASAIMLGFQTDEPVCHNRLAVELSNAGWTGEDNRIAWAIVNRESNNKPAMISDDGGYGLFQIQESVWSSHQWWDWDTVLTREGNIGMARALWKRSGWSPWGLDKSGNFDFSSYSAWPEGQRWSWIVEPYLRYYYKYPCEG